jgi:hypothetical protein
MIGDELDLQILGLSHYDDLGDVGDIGALSPMVGDIGAAPMLAHRMPAQVHKAMARQHAIRRLLPQVPGTPAPGGRFYPFPLLASAFTATSLATQTFSPTPQHPFKGRRLVYTETRTGTTATGLVTILNLAVGTNIQQAATGSLPAGAFAPGAYDTDLALDPCGPGVNISGAVVISALPTMTDRVDFSLAIWGETIA